MFPRHLHRHPVAWLDWCGLIASEAAVLAAAATNLYDIEERYERGEAQDWRTPLAMLTHRICTIWVLAARLRDTRAARGAALVFACVCASVSFVLWAVTVGMTLHHNGDSQATYLGTSLGVSLGGGFVFALIAACA